MDISRRFVVLGVIAFLFTGALYAGQEGAAPQKVSLTPEQMEVFLTKARIVRMRDAGGGVTASRRATLSDGTVTHDAHVQVVDIERPTFEAGKVVELNFKDLSRYNIAGYRLAILLGMDNVPMSVERQIEGKTAAITWWVDDVKMDEKERLKQKTAGPNPGRTTSQLALMRVWDELIQNKDRNQGNIIWTSDWKLWLIDHTRAFRWNTALLRPEQLARCEKGFLERLRALTPEKLAAGVGESMTKQEMSALMTRRDAIVKHFDERIAKIGAGNVLFTLE